MVIDKSVSVGGSVLVGESVFVGGSVLACASVFVGGGNGGDVLVDRGGPNIHTKM